MTSDTTKETPDNAAGKPPEAGADTSKEATQPEEIGGPKGPEPTRFGDWEKGGRCTDF